MAEGEEIFIYDHEVYISGKGYKKEKKELNCSLFHPSEWNISKSGHGEALSPGSINPLSCCGMAEFYSTAYAPSFTLKMWEWWLAWHYLERASRYQSGENSFPYGGILIGSAVPRNNGHQKALMEWFEKTGWKEIGEFTNHVHSSKIHVFHYQLPRDLYKWRWKNPLSGKSYPDHLDPIQGPPPPPKTHTKKSMYDPIYQFAPYNPF